MLAAFLSRLRTKDGAEATHPVLLSPSDLANQEQTSGESACQDLTYEDALLDMEMRSLVRSTYLTASPPADSFGRLVGRIERHNTDYPQVIASRPHVSPRVYLTSLCSSMASHRLAGVVSTAVALLLVFFAIDPSVSRFAESRGAEPASISTNRVAPGHSRNILYPGSRGDPVSSVQYNAHNQDVRYDPTYDDPQTWTPTSAGQSKLRIQERSVAMGMIDSTVRHARDRRTDPGPQ